MNTQSRETGSVAFVHVFDLVENWRIQTDQWLDPQLARQIHEQTGVRICRATQGEEPNQTYWVYAHKPATERQLLMVAVMLK